jgi:hypothetical protein
MSRRVRVHQFILAQIAKPQTQMWRASDLFGVSHWRDVPADTEFPYTVPRMNLFTRFYLLRPRPMDFRVRIRWLDAPGHRPSVTGVFGPFKFRLPLMRSFATTRSTCTTCGYTVSERTASN